MKVLDKGMDFASEIEIGSGTVWLPFKNILDIVSKSVQDNSTDVFTDLDSIIKKYKVEFANFLNYKGKNTSDREIIRKAVSEGIALKGQESRQVLHPQLVNETLLLSDLFEINEFLALDLLATAEGLKEEYPGWARGLIAVFLYYEGRLSMIQTLSTMVTAIPGRTWESSLCFPRITSLFKSVLECTFKNDVMDCLLGHLSKCDVKGQLENLENNLALGDWRHRYEINRLINGIKDGIAFLVFAQCAQQDVGWKEVLRLLEYVKTNVKLESRTKLDKAQTLLITAVVFAITNHLDVRDYQRSFARELLKYLKDQGGKTSQEGGFQCPEILDFFRLVFQIATRKATAESNMNNTFEMDKAPDVVKDDEELYLRSDIFAFFRDRMFCDSSLYILEESIPGKYHSIFSDFVMYMALRVKEMKARSDDAAKTAALYQNQGFIRPANLPQDYESFLECLGMFYSHDQDGHSLDYFNPDIHFLSLNKLVRGTCIDPPTFFIPNARFLAGIGKGAPEDVFDLMRQNGHNFSFEHFFDAVMSYLTSYGSNPRIGLTCGTSFFASEGFQKVVHESVRLQMNPAEIEGICVYLDLVKVICENSFKVSGYFTSQKQQWIRILLEGSKIRAIPREIRARMIGTAASMISEQSPGDCVTSVWDTFYQLHLIGQDSVGFKEELEEHEARLEEYQLTISVLKLLNALISARFKKFEAEVETEQDGFGTFDSGSFDPYIAYVRDGVLLRAGFRGYKNADERWELTALALNILSRLLDYVPQLMLQLLCGSPLSRAVLLTLTDCVQAREATIELQDPVNRCALAALNLVRRAMYRQSYFLHKKELSEIRHEAVIVGMQELLMRVVSDSGRPAHMIAVLKFIDTMHTPEHRQAALDILWLALNEREDIDVHLYACLVTDHNLVELLRYMFINSLYEAQEFDEMRKAVLQIIRVSVVHSSPNLGMLLLGVDKKVDFQNAGVGGYPRTVLHAILDNASNLPDAFCTLLTLLRDPRLWNPLLRYLKTNQFLSLFIKNNFPPPSMEPQDIGYLLKCIAVEMKTTTPSGPLALHIVGEGSSKFQEVLSLLELDEEPMEMPELEFFDQANVLQAMKSCEYFDPKLKIRVIRTDMLDSLLKEEIAKLEKNTVIKLRHTVHREAKDIVRFAVEFNSNRWKETCKAIMFDGWRQCLEVLVLSAETVRAAGPDFVSSALRVLLSKVVGTANPREYFCRLAAETVLTLCAVLATFHNQVNNTTLNVVLNHMCKWISEEQSARVRATLYSAMLHIVRLFKNVNEAGGNTVAAFALVIDNVSRDCTQAKDIGRMQAMYMMGELIRLTSDKGLYGGDFISDSASVIFERDMLQYSTNAGNPEVSKSFHPMFDSTMEKAPQSVTMMDVTMARPGSSMMDTSLNLRDGSFNVTTPPLTPRGSNPSLRSIPITKPANAATTPQDKSYKNLSILTYFTARGFLSNLVDGILTIDDGDLAKLFSSQPLQANLRGLYVFEAKLALLGRFAATGKKSVMFLLDTNVVHKLADMRVLQIQYFQEEMSLRGLPALMPSASMNTSMGFNTSGVGSLTNATRKGVMNTLLTTVLKLLHEMVDAAPKNAMLVEHIWHFLTIHAIPISNLFNRNVVEMDEPSVSCNLTLALLAKIAKLFPAPALTDRTNIRTRIDDILKLQSVHPAYSKFRIHTLHEVFLILHNYSLNEDAVRVIKRSGVSRRIRLIMNKKLTHDLLGAHPEEELTIGILVKIITDISVVLLNWKNCGTLPKDRERLGSFNSVLELGMELIHEHIEYFMLDREMKPTSKAFAEEFLPHLNNKLVKFVGEAGKVTGKGDFIDMLLLRTRRMINSAQ